MAGHGRRPNAGAHSRLDGLRKKNRCSCGPSPCGGGRCSSADRPAGGGEADFGSPHVCKRRADRLDDPGARLLVELLEGSAEWTEADQMASQVPLGQDTAHVDRPAGREVRWERRRSMLGRRHERVLRGAPPCWTLEIGFLSGRGPEVGEGLDRVIEEHHSEARDDPIEACRLERTDPGVGADEAGRRSLALGPGPGLGRGNHRRRNVDASGSAARTKAPRNGDRGAARAVADIESPSRDGASRGEALGEEVLERLQHLIQHVLRIDPGASGRHFARPVFRAAARRAPESEQCFPAGGHNEPSDAMHGGAIP